MLRSELSIRQDTIAASEKDKEALHQCLYIVRQYSEDEIKALILKEKILIRSIKDLRLEHGNPKFMKTQFKQAKTHLRWLKYLIIKPKRSYSKSTQLRRKNK